MEPTNAFAYVFYPAMPFVDYFFDKHVEGIAADMQAQMTVAHGGRRMSTSEEQGQQPEQHGDGPASTLQRTGSSVCDGGAILRV